MNPSNNLSFILFNKSGIKFVNKVPSLNELHASEPKFFNPPHTLLAKSFILPTFSPIAFVDDDMNVPIASFTCLDFIIVLSFANFANSFVLLQAFFNPSIVFVKTPLKKVPTDSNAFDIFSPPIQPKIPPIAPPISPPIIPPTIGQIILPIPNPINAHLPIFLKAPLNPLSKPPSKPPIPLATLDSDHSPCPAI